jgi:hypothetical protein
MIKSFLAKSAPPVRLQLGLVQGCPLKDQRPSPGRQSTFHNPYWIDADHSLVFAVPSVKVSGFMIAMIHKNDYPVELGDSRHIALL